MRRLDPGSAGGEAPRRELVLELLRRYGWNSTAHQILNPGIAHFVSSRGDAVTGYVDYGRVRVAAGVPICAAERLLDAMSEFESGACRHERRVCYFYAEERAQHMVTALPEYSVVEIGAQPVWDPKAWEMTFDRHASLRAQRHRARNKGVRIVEWDRQSATNHPLLERCLVEWMQARPMAEMHFLVEPETLGFLEGRRVFVAEQHTQPVGFLLASPVPLRRGWLIEQVIRRRRAPNGTTEMLIDAAVKAMAADGDSFVTLGLVPLASGEAGVPNPRWLRLLFAWTRAHGRRFYNFDGLERFKAKFRPHRWERIYMISQERQFSITTLIAVAGVFSGGRLGRAIYQTLRRAVTLEFRWLRGVRADKVVDKS